MDVLFQLPNGKNRRQRSHARHSTVHFNTTRANFTKFWIFKIHGKYCLIKTNNKTGRYWGKNYWNQIRNVVGHYIVWKNFISGNFDQEPGIEVQGDYVVVSVRNLTGVRGAIFQGDSGLLLAPRWNFSVKRVKRISRCSNRRSLHQN